MSSQIKKNQPSRKFKFSSDFQEKIINAKYCHLTKNGKKENFEEAIYRVAYHSNKYDKNKKEEMVEKTKTYIFNQEFSPAGGIWRAAGNESVKISAVNCTTQEPVDDSIESIFSESIAWWSRIASYGQGNGLDISGLRPRGSKTHNCANTSTGSVSFLQCYDSAMQVIGAENRRGATKPDIWIYHPDSEEFINCKNDITKLTSQNISIKVDSKFMKAVRGNKKIELLWERKNNKVYVGSRLFNGDSKGPDLKMMKKVNARELFDKIALSAWMTGEPGIEFWDISERYSNSNYHPDKKYHIVSTNGCCVTEDTEMLTNLGYEKIGNLVDKKTSIWNGMEWSEVTPKVMGENKKIYEVVLSDKTKLKCTGNHKWKVALHIDKTGTPKPFDKTTLELEPGMRLQKFEMPIIEYFQELEYAYQNGFWTGDGSGTTTPYIHLYNEKKKLANFLKVDKEPSNHSNDRIYISLATIKNKIKNKYFVPFRYTVSSRLKWLAGIVDSDGYLCDSGSLQIGSTNSDFLVNIRQMLTTLGVQAKVVDSKEEGFRPLPDGKGDYKKYICKKSYRLLISAWDVKHLREVGFETMRIDLSGVNPNRDARQFIRIEEVNDLNFIADKVYCATEPKNNTLTFNGIVTSNSEQKLDPWNTCILSSINLFKMPKFSEDWKPWLRERVRFGIRFLDNVIDMEYEEKRSPHPLQREKLRDMPRIGLGFTGLADWFIKSNIVYGSSKSIKVLDEVMKVFCEESYRTSIQLGKEKGSFTEFDPSWFCKSDLIKRICELTDLNIEDFTHLRHVCTMSIAPTGTLSMVVDADGSGTEPFYLPYMIRKERASSGEYQEHYIFSSRVKEELEKRNLKPTKENADVLVKEEKWIFANDLKPENKIELMKVIYKYIDSGVSVTYNLPKNATVDDIKNIYMKAWEAELKSVTVYRDGCREGVLTKELNKEKIKIEKHDSIKRPKKLPCEIHSLSVNKQKWVVLVGFMDEDPYEIFCGLQEDIELPKNNIEGYIVKEKRSVYKLQLMDGFSLNIKKAFSNLPHESALTRIISTSLRHGVDVKYVVHQLEKSQGHMGNFSKAIAKVLKKYIKEGTKVTGESCPSCGESNLIRQAGCVTCSSCGWSRC